MMQETRCSSSGERL
ncbi:hypothetical protein LINPERPRIM_LOCUS27422 [Linum perenne]